MTRPPAMTFNVYKGNRAPVLSLTSAAADAGHPDVIFAQECYGLRGKVPGYQMHRPGIEHAKSDQRGDVAVLVRNGLRGRQDRGARGPQRRLGL